MTSSAGDRENKLKNLSQILDNENNRQDKAGIMSQLSQEFNTTLRKQIRQYFDGLDMATAKRPVPIMSEPSPVKLCIMIFK